MPSKALKNLTARISLICYLVVSSIAATHAFPAMSSTPLNEGLMVGLVISVDSENVGSMHTTDPHCAQMLEPATSTESGAAVSVCKLFCAAMTNVIAHSSFTSPSRLTTNTLIAFPPLHLISIAPQIEIQPPQPA